MKRQQVILAGMSVEALYGDSDNEEWIEFITAAVFLWLLMMTAGGCV